MLAHSLLQNTHQPPRNPPALVPLIHQQLAHLTPEAPIRSHVERQLHRPDDVAMARLAAFDVQSGQGRFRGRQARNPHDDSAGAWCGLEGGDVFGEDGGGFRGGKGEEEVVGRARQDLGGEDRAEAGREGGAAMSW
jgi:hypothetical protein